MSGAAAQTDLAVSAISGCLYNKCDQQDEKLMNQQLCERLNINKKTYTSKMS